jgi:hypothetical protein
MDRHVIANMGATTSVFPSDNELASDELYAISATSARRSMLRTPWLAKLRRCLLQAVRNDQIHLTASRKPPTLSVTCTS